MKELSGVKTDLENAKIILALKTSDIQKEEERVRRQTQIITPLQNPITSISNPLLAGNQLSQLAQNQDIIIK